MIRQLTQRDYNIVRSYLDEEPLHNIYPIHGLQNYGLESDHVAFWGVFKANQLMGVLFADNHQKLQFGSLVGEDPGVLTELAKLAFGFGLKTWVGNSDRIMSALEGLPAQYMIAEMKHWGFYEIYPGQLSKHYEYPVRLATRDDIPLLVQLYKSYELGGIKTAERIEREIQRAMCEGGCYFFIEMERQAVSGARVHPQTDRVGMIDAAITLPEFRGRGMYPCVRTACFEYLFDKSKIGLGLVSDTNTAMHKLVSKDGGTFTARWSMVKFKKKTPLRQRILPLRLRRWALRVKNVALHS